MSGLTVGNMVKEMPINRLQASGLLLKIRSILLSTDAPPHTLALSFALGTLISLAPTPGLNTILTLLLMNFFRHLPRVGIMAAMAVWNVFVVTPMYALGYRLGLFLFGDTVIAQPTSPVLAQLSSLSRGFFLGNLIIAIVFASLCYLVIFFFWGWWRRRKHSEN